MNNNGNRFNCTITYNGWIRFIFLSFSLSFPFFFLPYLSPSLLTENPIQISQMHISFNQFNNKKSFYSKKNKNLT